MQRFHHIAGKDRHLHGYKKGTLDARDKRLTASRASSFTLPEKASLRGQPGLRVEDQGAAGSCVLNSSTTALEFVLMKEGVDVQLSRLYPYAKVRDLEGTPLTEDNGCEIRNAMKVFANLGCPTENLWSYDLSKLSVEPPPELDVEAAKHKSLLYYRCPNLETICSSIVQGFPVILGFQVPKSIFDEECTRTGMIKFDITHGFDGGHAVLVTGYDNSLGCLEILNSWGTGWGLGGYGYLPYDFVDQGYADDMFTVRRVAI